MAIIMAILASIVEGVDSFITKSPYSLFNMMVLYTLFFISSQLIEIKHNSKK